MKFRFVNKRYVYILIFLVLMCGAASALTQKYLQKFNGSDFNPNAVYQHIKELSSIKYAGRLAGSTGNQQALQYIENYFKQIGLQPAGENNTFYQQFKSMVPNYASLPVFKVTDLQEQLVAQYELGKDYFEILEGYGGAGSVQAELFVPAKNITSYSEAELKGKVVAVPGIRDNEASYAIEHGVKGIIVSSSKIARNPVPLEARKGKGLLLLSLSGEKFADLRAKANKQLQVNINLQIPYRQVDTPNILGKIEGKNKNQFVIISSQVDSLGSVPDGNYFPGALDSASGVGMMLELARIMKEQKIIPEKTVIFAGWNNEEFGRKGSKYYVEHPLFPLANSSVIQLSVLGGKDSSDALFASSGDVGTVFASRLMQYASDANVPARFSNGILASDQDPFLTKNIPTVLAQNTPSNLYYSTNYGIHTFRDTIVDIKQENLSSVGLALLNYARVEVFGDNFPRYLSAPDIALLLVYLLGLASLYFLLRLYKLNPEVKILALRLEDIYYSLPFNLCLKAYFYLTPVLLIFVSLVVISHFPMNFNLVKGGSGTISNLSWYLLIKQSVLYIKDLFTVGLGKSKYHINVTDALAGAFLKSSLLLLFALSSAFLFGTVKGIRDGFKPKGKGAWGILGTIGFLSVPDVLIVILVQLGIIYLSKYSFGAGLVKVAFTTKYLVPYLCLTVLPSVYISRIVATVVQEESQRDYVLVARAKGLSSAQIVFNHLLISTVIRVIDSLSGILTMMISNLIIVEYLCYYPGIVYGLLHYYQQNDTVPFIGFAMSLGLIYFTFSLLFKGLAKLINPMKREGVY